MGTVQVSPHTKPHEKHPMFLKIFTIILLGVLAWGAVRKLTGGGRAKPARKRRDVGNRSEKKPAETLVKCSDCGIYLPPGQRCTCDGRD